MLTLSQRFLLKSRDPKFAGCVTPKVAQPAKLWTEPAGKTFNRTGSLLIRAEYPK
jgi:hypothetical protein